MKDTSWRKRPGAFADVGNPTGLVTTPRDIARMGQLVLDGGKAADGNARHLEDAARRAVQAHRDQPVLWPSLVAQWRRL